MPAPDYATLYDFETQMEGAWQSVLLEFLAPLGITQVFVTRDDAVLDTPRVEVEFHVGNALNQRKAFPGPPYREIPNAFNAALVVRVVTTRALAENKVQHGPLRGLLRYNLSASANRIKAQTNLPYLQILEMLPASSVPRIIDEKEQDISEMQYSMQFAINNNAWPT